MANFIKLLVFLLPLFYFGSCSNDLQPVHHSVSTESIPTPHSISLWSMNSELVVDVAVLDSLRLDDEFLELVNVHSRSFLDIKIDSLLSLNLTEEDYQKKMVDEIIGYRLLKLKNYLESRGIPLEEYQKIYVYIKHELNLRESFISTRLAVDDVFIGGDPTNFLRNANTFVNMVANAVESIQCYNCTVNNTFPLLWDYYTDLLPTYMGKYSSATLELQRASNNFKFQITSIPYSHGFNTDNFMWRDFFNYFDQNYKSRLIYMVHTNTCGTFCPPDYGDGEGGGITNPPTPTDNIDPLHPDVLLGKQVMSKIRTDLTQRNVQIKEIKKTSTGQALLNAASVGTNVNGIITSCLNFLDQSIVDNQLAIKFGRNFGYAGLATIG